MQPYDDQVIIDRLVASLFPLAQLLKTERVQEGVSTIVYRISADAKVYYLRIAPEVGVDLAAEVAVHYALADSGLLIPDIIHYESCHQPLQRSLMVVTAIAGRSVGYQNQLSHIGQIMWRAGAELAMIQRIPVVGFGWLNRLDPSGGLVAEYSTIQEWLFNHFREPLAVLAHFAELAQEAEQLLILLDLACKLFAEEVACLAHGDFDLTHIYYDQQQFSGIIDFGEIRGAYWMYDLGHFAIENEQLLPDLLDGYRHVSGREVDLKKLELTALLIAARRIGRQVLQGRAPHPPDIVRTRLLLATWKS